MLTQHDLRDSLKMLHFHLGSQVTDIRRIKKPCARPQGVPKPTKSGVSSSTSMSEVG